jgi:hypothetical protein
VTDDSGTHLHCSLCTARAPRRDVNASLGGTGACAIAAKLDIYGSANEAVRRAHCGSMWRSRKVGIGLEQNRRVASALSIQGLGTGGTAMKKAALSLTTLAALTVTTVALADESNRMGGPTSTPSSSSVAPAPESTASAPCPQTVTTTTISSAEIAPAPIMAPPPPRETITVRQSFRPHRPLLYTGTSMFVSSYAATAAMTAVRDIRDANGDQSLYIPVAGPWLHLRNSSPSTLDLALIAGSGVTQGTGVFLSVLSLIVPEKVPAATIQAGSAKVLVTAGAAGSGAGVGAFGQF